MTIVLLSAILIGTTLMLPLNVDAQTRRPLNQLNIVIDPGHGGRDPNHRVIRRFSSGTRLTILNASRGWLQVRR